MTEFVCVSINYKRCSEEIRSKAAFSEEDKLAVLEELSPFEPVLLCTCNRTELYYFGNTEIGAEILSRLSGISESELLPKLMIFSGRKAVNHLFRVTCGIDSMVVGEDEILGQVKKAYTFSAEKIALSAETNMIFQAAVAAAKRIKTETDLSKTSVSTATLAAKTAAKHESVMLIGASGEIGGKVLKNLLSYKNVTVYITERSHRGKYLFPADSKAVLIDYDKRYEFAEKCGCIVSATSGPHFTITAEKLKNNIPAGKQLTLIDLAVPRDIDTRTTKIEGVSLVGIDSFEQLAKHNNEVKLNSVERAEEIIFQETEALEKQLSLHRFLPKLKEHGEELSVENIIYKMKTELSAEAFSRVIDVIEGMMC
ncbi:MAG: glutamyl-tRNA reductase [Oscillospiraceae bacterium]|nr:glutamyl-tRNA reductase [Oscillospiraceae bacterium]